jgi:hypothetical protein
MLDIRIRVEAFSLLRLGSVGWEGRFVSGFGSCLLVIVIVLSAQLAVPTA